MADDDVLAPDQDLGNGLMVRHLPEGDFYFPSTTLPTEPSDDLHSDPYSKSFKSTDVAPTLPVKRNNPMARPEPTQTQTQNYVMAPDLMDTQQDQQNLPSGIAVNDAGIPFNKLTGAEIPTVQRPNVLPVARTPDGGFTLAMPKMLDLASNVMAPLAAPSVATKAGEVVLGSGAVKTAQEAAQAAPAAAAPFYSTLEQAVNNAKLNKGDAQQWLGYLKNQPGVKSEEINTVLGDLPAGQITKSELGQIVQDNKVQLGEKVKSNEPFDYDVVSMGDDGYSVINNKTEEAVGNIFETKSEAQNYLEQLQKESDNTKFQQYQLPGGENYKEMLMTLPEKKGAYTADTLPQGYKLEPYSINAEKKWRVVGPGQEGRLEQYGSGSTPDAAMQRFNNLHGDAGNFKSSHWDEPNVLAHIRMNDRMVGGPTQATLDNISERMANALGTDVKSLGSGAPEYAVRNNIITPTEAADITKAKGWINKFKGLPGSEKKSLHIEEYQSDLHQKGRDQGYVGEKEKLQPEFDKIENKLMATNDDKLLGQPTVKGVLKDAVEKKIITQDEANTYKRYTDIENGTPVPDFPFKKNWEELALKRMLHKAATEGYDGLSITPGEAQALRYPDELRKKVSSIEWHNKTNGKVDLDGNKKILVEHTHSSEGQTEFTINKDGIVISGPSQAKGKHLSEVIGKNMAANILNKSEGSIDAKDFVMGAEGMKAAYDKRGVDILNNIVKKYGSKVEQEHLPLSDTSKQDLKRKLMEETKPDEIALNQYGKQWDELVADKKAIEAQNADPKIKSSTTYKQAGLARINQIEDELNNLHGKSVSDTVDRIIKNTKGQPIHYLPITPELRAKAKSGFPLFSTSPTLTPILHNPFDNQDKKYKLTPIPGNPFIGQ